MILFKPTHVIPILTGRKTVTRRQGKKRWRVGSVHQCYTTPPFARGGASPFTKVIIEAVYEQTLGLMDEEDARKEGGYTLRLYRKMWREINGEWNPKELVWVVEFTVIEGVSF